MPRINETIFAGLVVGCGMPHRSGCPDITAVANKFGETVEVIAVDQIILPKQSLLKLVRTLEPLFGGRGAQVAKRTNGPLPRPARCANRLDEPIVGIRPALITAGGTAEVYAALQSIGVGPICQGNSIEYLGTALVN